MKILMIGDVVGKPGRRAVRELLPKLKKEYGLDLVIANADNLAHGVGLTQKTAEEMFSAGVDVLTGGNHVWSNQDGVEALEDKKLHIIRPANFPAHTPGRGEVMVKVGRVNVLVINVQGNVFVEHNLACPFTTVDQVLKKYAKKRIKAVLVDFHAEATSEKVAMRYHVDGRVAAVVGTHTHVPTADAMVSEKGTASITDLGMVGPQRSVLGVKPEIILQKFITQMPMRHELEEEGKVEFGGAVIEIDNKSGKAKKITPVFEVWEPRG